MPNPSERLPPAVLEDASATEKEKEVPRRRSIVHEFCLNTTAHGLPGIARSESRHNCLFWTIASIGFFGVMVFFVVKAILAYLQYPTSMDASIASERPQNFPAFSFCNISPLRLDLFRASLLNDSSVDNGNATNTNDTTGSQSPLQQIVKFLVNRLNRNESIQPLVYSLPSMLYTCVFNNVPCSPSDFIEFTSAVYGACYTFNAKLRDSTGQQILDANAYGGDGKLSLGLYIHSHQYIPYLVDGFGVVALVHDNTQLPLIEEAGMELAPGRRHKLGYSKKTTSFLRSPYTTCTDQVSFSMAAMFENYNNADYGYSETVCYQLCGQVYAYEQCGCVSPVLWSSRTLYIPSLKRVIFASLCEYTNPCYTKAIGELLTSSTLMNDHCSNCSGECSITSFDVQPSSLSSPAGWQLADIKIFVENSSIPLSANWSSTWYEQIPKNYLAINVVRETSIVQSNVQSASTGFVDLISNLGGQSGLWIGISFLSIMEILEILYRLIRREYHARRRTIQSSQL